MTILTSCGPPPIRPVWFLLALVVLLLLPVLLRRMRPTVGIVLRVLVTPVLLLSIVAVWSAMCRSNLQRGLFASGAEGPGLIAAGLAEEATWRLLGLSLTLLVAVASCIWLLRTDFEPSLALPGRPSLCLAIPLGLGLWSGVTSLRPEATDTPSLVPLVIAVLSVLVSGGLAAVAPRTWKQPASRVFAALGATMVLSTIVVQLLSAYQDRTLFHFLASR